MIRRTTLLRSARAALGPVLFCAATPLLLAAEALPTTRRSTEVVRAVDDKEQDAKLLGGDQRADGAAARAIKRMNEATRRLAREFDPGAETQEVQRRILGDIDELIDALNKCRPKDG